MRKLLLTTALCLVPAGAFAGDTLAFRIMMHAVAAQSQDIADVDGHSITLFKYSGLASFPDGTVGTITVTGTADYIKGNGTFGMYSSVTTADGSTLWFKTSAGAAAVEGNVTHLKAPLTIVGGAGKFAGAKGDGTLSGARLQPRLTGGAETYSDIALNLK